MDTWMNTNADGIKSQSICFGILFGLFSLVRWMPWIDCAERWLPFSQNYECRRSSTKPTALACKACDLSSWPGKSGVLFFQFFRRLDSGAGEVGPVAGGDHGCAGCVSQRTRGCGSSVDKTARSERGRGWMNPKLDRGWIGWWNFRGRPSGLSRMPSRSCRCATSPSRA